MILPTMKLISDDTKKQLTDLGIVLIQRADLTSRFAKNDGYKLIAIQTTASRIKEAIS